MIPNIGWFSKLLEYFTRVTFAKIKKKKKSQGSSNCYPLPISKAFNWANSIKGDRVIYWSYLGLSILSLTLLNWTELLLYPPQTLSYTEWFFFQIISSLFPFLFCCLSAWHFCCCPIYLSYYLFQASILEWVAISFRASSTPRHRTRVSPTAKCFYHLSHEGSCYYYLVSSYSKDHFSYKYSLPCAFMGLILVLAFTFSC